MTGEVAGARRPLFTGSYSAHDCEFLLKPLSIEATSVAEKERSIQSGMRHYSEMLTPEEIPSRRYLQLFQSLVDTYAGRVGHEIMSLAAHIGATRRPPYTVVSLARAGTPIGALLTRALRMGYDANVRHYSISIIRDRGIDENALRYMLRIARRATEGLFFVDGWTAKGVIGRELRCAVAKWNAENPELLDPRLYVLSDIGGSADVAASYHDYAIPSGILNATVSGLVSRSILNSRVGPGDFHGCVHYSAFKHVDQTNWYINRIAATFPSAVPRPLLATGRQGRAEAMARWLADCMRKHSISDENLIKPGVAESTRVLLRRIPELLIVRDTRAFDLRHLLVLAEERQVPIEIDPDLPFLSAALIRSFRSVSVPAMTLTPRSEEP